jgi:glycosyl transferase family 87
MAAGAREGIAGRSDRPPRSHLSASAPLAAVLAVGFAARLALLPAAPTLSEDVYRYLWDGRLVAAGVNPYPLPPSDPTLQRFRDGSFHRLNHADVPTIYPPAAQLLFAATTRLAPTPLAWKLVLLAAESALVVALVGLLRRRRLPPERLLLYYWNPLVLIESYGSGHIDLLAAVYLGTALFLLEAGRRVPAGVAFAIAVLTKYVPALVLPYLARRRAFVLLTTAALTGALLFVPFLGAGRSLWTGLVTYGRHWEFNGALFGPLRAWIGSGDRARAILAAGLAAATLGICLRARTATGAAIACSTAFLLASPTVFPWYAIPAIAFLPLHPDLGLLAFSGLLPLSYLPLAQYRATGVWSLPPWVLWVEYGGLAAAWLLAAIARRRAGAQGRAAAWARESEPT